MNVLNIEQTKSNEWMNERVKEKTDKDKDKDKKRMTSSLWLKRDKVLAKEQGRGQKTNDIQTAIEKG